MYISKLDGELFLEAEINFQKVCVDEFISLETLNKIAELYNTKFESTWISVYDNYLLSILKDIYPELRHWVLEYNFEEYIKDNQEIRSCFYGVNISTDGCKIFCEKLNNNYGFKIDEVIQFKKRFYVDSQALGSNLLNGYQFSYFKLLYNDPEAILRCNETTLVSFEAIALMFSKSMYTHVNEEVILDNLRKKSMIHSYLTSGVKEPESLSSTLTKRINRHVRSRLKKTYLMKDEVNGYYKIGNSINPKYRERTLQSEKPTIRLLMSCGSNIEKDLHSIYKNFRLRGEWFCLTQDQYLDIKSIMEKESNFISYY